MLVNVPEDAIPGVTQLSLRFGDSHQTVLVTVPGSVRIGDQLRFHRNLDGTLRCSIERSPELDRSNLACRRVLRIPDDAKPGVTVLVVDVGAETPLHVKVPPKAHPGDSLVLTHDAALHTWGVKILRHVNPSTEELLLPTSDLDSDTVFNNICSAVRRDGGFVSNKIKRGSAAPLHILGVIARERIEANEEIARIPNQVHLSYENCRQVFTDIIQESSSIFFKGNADDVALSICIAKLISQMVDSTLPVWSAYAAVLICESFECHPLVRAHANSERVATMLEHYADDRKPHATAGDIRSTYDLICASLDEELLGKGFTLGAYYQSRLCMLTRSFEMNGQSVLVPVCDFFNHHPSPGLEFRAESQAMVLYAKREHAAGEELFISYGSKSNPVLFGAYGFTVPPSMEPSWGFSCHSSRIPKDLYNRYLPAQMENFCIHFESTGMHESLTAVLNACVVHGSDPALFLRALCSTFIAHYENDEQLRPFLSALERARAKLCCSAAWWDEISEEDFIAIDQDDCYIDWRIPLLRIKMSKYLCLKAHLEVFDVMEGRIMQEQCLANAVKIRNNLLSALPILSSGEEIALRTIKR